MNREQFEKVTKWQDEVFTKATPVSCVNHLVEEVGELKKELENGNVDRSEIADCFLLLAAVCNKSGLNYQDIEKSIDEKMLVNYSRKWGQPNEKGYVKHVS